MFAGTCRLTLCSLSPRRTDNEQSATSAGTPLPVLGK
jgi:hypothetical protein